jgi:hypothetical protein
MSQHTLHFININFFVPFSQNLEWNTQWNNMCLIFKFRAEFRIISHADRDFLEKVSQSKVPEFLQGEINT